MSIELVLISLQINYFMKIEILNIFTYIHLLCEVWLVHSHIVESYSRRSINQNFKRISIVTLILAYFTPQMISISLRLICSSDSKGLIVRISIWVCKGEIKHIREVWAIPLIAALDRVRNFWYIPIVLKWSYIVGDMPPFILRKSWFIVVLDVHCYNLNNLVFSFSKGIVSRNYQFRSMLSIIIDS